MTHSATPVAWRRVAGASAVGLALAGPAAPAAADEEYSFDVARFEKKAFEFGGYTELRLERFRLNPDGAQYQLNAFDKPRRKYLHRSSAAVEVGGIYRRGITAVQATAHADTQSDAFGARKDLRLYEGFLSVEPVAGRRLEIGKRALRWGKGYAWNPVGFVERPKDPNDPELSREGFVAVAASAVRTTAGPLQSLSLTVAIVPTDDHLNQDFGTGSHLNPAVKLSLLYRDTDIDFLALGRGARSPRYGFDFSRNLGSNLEVHGEWARVRDNVRPVYAPAGPPVRRSADASSYLLGLRYLSAGDTTWIAELYRNGAGYRAEEARDYSAAVHAADAQYQAGGDPAVFQRVSAVQESYARPNGMRRYLYLRVAQKEPFDILYLSPAITAIANLDDHSFSVAPELVYTGLTNIELRARIFFIQGERLSDFGERQNSRRIEFRARLTF